MRICYIADGMSIHTQIWANYFAGRGHEVHLISSRFLRGYEGCDDRIKFYPLIRLFPQIWRVSGYLSGILWLLQVRGLVKKIKPDILDAHFITVCGYLGVISGFHPLILTAWGSDILITPKQNPIHRFLTKHCLKKADPIICVSFAMKEAIIELGCSPDKIEITPVGVDTQKFSPSHKEETNAEIIGSLSVLSRVISTRNLEPIYNVETLIKAVPLILNEVPKVEFVIVGDGRQRDFLMNLARSLKVSNNIRFVGWVSHDDLPQYLASATIYVSTSLSDGASISLFEAMAQGLAPVVTSIPANQTWVRDGENGFLIPVSDHEALSNKITFLLKNDSVRARFGRISRKIIEERAEFNRELSRVEEMYRQLAR